jgi:N-acetylglucosamine repressor
VRKIDVNAFTRATRGTGRDINRQIVLNLVHEHQPLSRADLARRMKMGRGRITSLVAELLEIGLIVEGDPVNAPRGRRPRMLRIRTEDRLVVAVDVRLGRTYLMLSDFGGSEIAMGSFRTVVDPEELVAVLAARIERLLEAYRSSGRCEGIGLVVPGMVNQRTGRVLNAPQLGWREWTSGMPWPRQQDFRSSLKMHRSPAPSRSSGSERTGGMGETSSTSAFSRGSVPVWSWMARSSGGTDTPPVSSGTF